MRGRFAILKIINCSKFDIAKKPGVFQAFFLNFNNGNDFFNFAAPIPL